MKPRKRGFIYSDDIRMRPDASRSGPGDGSDEREPAWLMVRTA